MLGGIFQASLENNNINNNHHRLAAPFLWVSEGRSARTPASMRQHAV
jgi:hypothetical protein